MNVKRLIAPIGRSRLNLLAALERVSPQQLIAITTEQNHNLTANCIKNASGLNDMDVEILTLSNAFDIELVRDEMNLIAGSFPPTEFDYTLISGSTNQICYMCHMHWPGVTVSIKRGLVSSIGDIDVEHSIKEDDFLLLYNLVKVDGKLCQNDETLESLFPASNGFEIDNKNGNIKIYWELGIENHYKMSNQIRDQVSKISEDLGRKTFHHYVKCIQPFKLHKEIEDLITFELEEEEE